MQTLQPADAHPESAPLTVRSIAATTGVILSVTAVVGYAMLVM